jgi:hypothetical protein
VCEYENENEGWISEGKGKCRGVVVSWCFVDKDKNWWNEKSDPVVNPFRDNESASKFIFKCSQEVMRVKITRKSMP